LSDDPIEGTLMEEFFANGESEDDSAVDGEGAGKTSEGALPGAGVVISGLRGGTKISGSRGAPPAH
jgi:hypothetical protein